MNDYSISTDKSNLNIDVIFSYLSKESYWSMGIQRDVLIRSIENSLCFGVFYKDEQIGFARVITDYATFGYLADVFILEPHRGKGLSKLLMQTITDHPKLQGFRRMMLATKDAHLLYKQYGYSELSKPDRWMEKWNPEVYKRK